MLWTNNLVEALPSCWEDLSFNAFRRLGKNNLLNWANRFVNAVVTNANMTVQDAAAIFGFRWVMEEYLTLNSNEVRNWLGMFFEWSFWVTHTMTFELGIGL